VDNKLAALVLSKLTLAVSITLLTSVVYIVSVDSYKISEGLIDILGLSQEVNKTSENLPELKGDWPAWAEAKILA